MLLIGESNVATGALTVYTICCLEDPNGRQDGEGEGGPVSELANFMTRSNVSVRRIDLHG